MVMDTGIMGSPKPQTNPLACRSPAQGGLGVLLIACSLPQAHARVWDFTLAPTMTISQTYSDNLRLQSSSRAAGGFVTELAPGLSVARESGRSKFNLNARLQYLYYEGIDISPRLYPQLQMTSKTELIDDSIFLDSSSTIGQGNAGAFGGFASSNIYQSSTVNSTTYRTFRLSPYWVIHLGGYAEGEARVGYSSFGNSSSNNSASANSIGNLGSDSFQESLYLHSGKSFDSSGVAWRLNANNQEQNYQQSTSSHTRFRAVNGEVSYRVFPDIGMFIQTGYYDNYYPNNYSTKNGVYVTPGLSWTPSPNFSLSVGYGLNSYFANVAWHPSQRTSFQLGYRNSQVGGSPYGSGGYGGGGGIGLGIDGGGYGAAAGSAGTGAYPTGALGAPNAGSTWNGSLTHTMRTVSLTATYYTTTTTVQQLLANQSTFTTPTDANGNPIGNATANDRAINLPNLTNGPIISSRASLSVSWALPRSSAHLNVYQNDITYTADNRTQHLLGVTANWNWRFSPRTDAILSGSWQSSDYSSATTTGNNTKNEYLSATLMLNRQFSQFVTGSLQFSHYQAHSNNRTSVSNALLGGIGSYDTNRVTASVSVKF